MSKQDEILKNKLLEKARKEFPKLTFSKAELVKEGDDHVVIVLDEILVMRFPTAAYRKTFIDELKLLKALQAKTPVRIPDYVYVSKKKDFGGYPLIAGKELTPARFARLTSKQKQKFAKEIGNFLSVLHSLSERTLPPRRSTEPWDGVDLKYYYRRYLKERRATLARHVDKKTLALLDDFYPLFLSVAKTVPKKKVIHGDITDDHLLVDTKRGHFAGLIDFGDAAFGDPAYDFCFFWRYGDKVAQGVYKHYKHRSDKKLLMRSEWHYVRFLADRLYYEIRDKDMTDVPKNLVALKKKLRDLV